MRGLPTRRCRQSRRRNVQSSIETQARRPQPSLRALLSPSSTRATTPSIWSYGDWRIELKVFFLCFQVPTQLRGNFWNGNCEDYWDGVAVKEQHSCPKTKIGARLPKNKEKDGQERKLLI